MLSEVREVSEDNAASHISTEGGGAGSRFEPRGERGDERGGSARGDRGDRGGRGGGSGGSGGGGGSGGRPKGAPSRFGSIGVEMSGALREGEDVAGGRRVDRGL